MMSIQRGHSARLARRVSIAVACGVLLASFLAPQALGQSEQATRENVTLEGSYTDVQFLAGRSVTVKANVADDVFAAGRDVTFDSATVRGAIVAGYDVEQRGGSVADMIAVAANLNVAGGVEDDLVAAGRSIRISSNGTIGGDARLAAETIDMEGRIGGNVRAAARRITIRGEIAGKADLLAERIVIAPGATITGDLIYRSEAKPEIADGATIGGEIRRVAIDMPDLRSIGLALVGIGLFIALAWAIGMLLLIIIAQLAFPGLMADAVERLRASPWSNLGRGVVILLLAVVVAGVLFASIVGIPLGGILAMGTAVVWVLGLSAVSCRIGLLIRGWLRRPVDVRNAGLVGWAVVGAIVLGLVALVPILGNLVAGLAVAAGVGATGAELWQRLRAA